MCARVCLSHIFCLFLSLMYFISRLFLSLSLLQSKRKIQDTHTHIFYSKDKPNFFLSFCRIKRKRRGDLRERKTCLRKRIIPMMNQSANRYGISFDFSSVDTFIFVFNFLVNRGNKNLFNLFIEWKVRRRFPSIY